MIRKLIEKQILKTHQQNRRKRSFRWAKKGERVKIFFHADDTADVARLEKRLLLEGIETQSIMIADTKLDAPDYLTIYTCNGWLLQLFNRDKLVDELLEGGILLNLYSGSHYLVDYLVAQDSATFKIGINVPRTDLYDFRFETDEGTNCLKKVSDMMECLDNLHVQPTEQQRQDKTEKQ